jgi:hypothetical protein
MERPLANGSISGNGVNKGNGTSNDVNNGHGYNHVKEPSYNNGSMGPGEDQTTLAPAMRLSWQIQSVDAVFASKVPPRLSDLSKEAMIQHIKDGDLRFLTVRSNIEFIIY